MVAVVWRVQGRVEHLHRALLHNQHLTSVQMRLCLWKRSAEIFSFAVMLKYLTWGNLLCSYRWWNMHLLKTLTFFILFLNTVGYLFMWQKQGCPASVYSKYFICQVLAALVTSSPVLFLMFNWIHFHCSLNFPSPVVPPPPSFCLAIPIHFLKVLICILRALHSVVCLRG